MAAPGLRDDHPHPTLPHRGEGFSSPDSEAGLAVYVHWPFCLKKCPYCDFNSHVRERIDEAAWVRAIGRELDHFAALVPGRTVTSVFFGGGTPSLMSGAAAGAVLDRVARLWSVDGRAEITLEANPTSVEAAKFRDFRAVGINRVSLGIQALDDAALKFLGRAHSAAEARAAIAIAAAHVDRYSFDLIYARPGQTLDRWAAELDAALELAGDHLSVYQLTIEEGTAFEPLWRRGDLVLPDEDLAAGLFELTQDRLAAAGLPAYEVSNHARPGSESRHNLTYWRYDDYVGVGPGAHGRLTIGGAKHATRQRRAPEAWLSLVEAQSHGTDESVPVDRGDRLVELVMMGLRLSEGIPRARFRDQLGAEPEEVLDRQGLADLIEGGFVTLDGERLNATERGRPVLSALIARLLPRDD